VPEAGARLGAPADIVGSSLNRLRAVLAPLQVSTDVPAELPLLFVHAALIEQALVNVLENAARFSPPHGRLQLSAGANDEELFFSVSDEGPGIPEDERAKIFDMFYTAARGDRGGQGTGWGWRSVRAWSAPMAGDQRRRRHRRPRHLHHLAPAVAGTAGLESEPDE
jgi:K+-sensing histidine kinase KdpD